MLIGPNKTRFSEIRLLLFPPRVIPFPLAELVLRGSGLVPDFRVFQFDVAANLSFAF
jgi:hypothetical protein